MGVMVQRACTSMDSSGTSGKSSNGRGPARAWHGVSDAPRTYGSVLRVLQLNVLADSLAEGSEKGTAAYECPARLCEPGSCGVHYYRTPGDRPCHVFRTAPQHLTWAHRLPQILREIKTHNPDIICLQEVDRYDDFKSALEAAGYTGCFLKKACKKAQDGCAVFWRKARLSLLQQEGIQILPYSAMVAIMVRLVTRTGIPVVVCSTHLKAGFSAAMEDERLMQAAELSNQLDKFAGAGATILSADLNTHFAPYASSGDGAEDDASTLVEPKVVPLLVEKGYHSAYGGFPPFTTWAGWADRDVKATLDYILIRGPAIAQNALDLPSEEFVAQYPDRLPNQTCPSDHMCLVADIEVMPSQFNDAHLQWWYDMCWYRMMTDVGGMGYVDHTNSSLNSAMWRNVWGDSYFDFDQFAAESQMWPQASGMYHHGSRAR